MVYIVSNTKNNEKNGIYIEKKIVKNLKDKQKIQHNIDINIESYKSENEAIIHFKKNNYEIPIKIKNLIKNYPKHYTHYITDGSTKDKQLKYTLIIIDESQVPIYTQRKIITKIKDKNVTDNLYIELMGSLGALGDAVINDYRNIVIHYDCQTIEDWTKPRKIKKSEKFKRKYYNYFKNQRKYRNIKFHHIKSHVGNIIDIADEYAKIN